MIPYDGREYYDYSVIAGAYDIGYDIAYDIGSWWLLLEKDASCGAANSNLT